MNYPQTITKAIFLNFNNSSNAEAYVSVPFQVKYIRVKSITYQATTPITTNIIGTLTSDLVQNNAMGAFNYNSQIGGSIAYDIDYASKTPQPVSGTYKFSALGINGTTPFVSPSNDWAQVVVEFRAEE